MRLVLTFADAQTAKMKRDDDEDSGIKGSSTFNQLSSANPPPLSQLDYPLVKYWERKV